MAEGSSTKRQHPKISFDLFCPQREEVQPTNNDVTEVFGACVAVVKKLGKLGNCALEAIKVSWGSEFWADGERWPTLYLLAYFTDPVTGKKIEIPYRVDPVRKPRTLITDMYAHDRREIIPKFLGAIIKGIKNYIEVYCDKQPTLRELLAEVDEAGDMQGFGKFEIQERKMGG